MIIPKKLAEAVKAVNGVDLAVDGGLSAI